MILRFLLQIKGTEPRRQLVPSLPREVIRGLVETLRHRFAVSQVAGMCSGDVSMILDKKNKIFFHGTFFIFFLVFFHESGCHSQLDSLRTTSPDPLSFTSSRLRTPGIIRVASS